MKKKAFTLISAAASFVLLAFLSCGKDAAPADGAGMTLDKDTSYAVGMYLAEQWNPPVGIHYDYNSFMEGFKDFTEQRETRLTRDASIEKVQAFAGLIQSELSKKVLEDEASFFTENGAKPGVVTTASGLQYEAVVEGAGPKPGPNDLITIHYEGKLVDGTVFDSSFERGEPVQLNLGSLIPGWKEGIQLMSAGSTYNFYIPSALGYGPAGAGGVIPPNAILIFKVELHSTESGN